MKALALLAILVVMVGCSGTQEPTPPAASPALANGSGDAMSMDNKTSATSTRSNPIEQPGASFKIEPPDKTKFPSNAAGGN